MLDEDEEIEPSVVHHKKLKEKNEELMEDIFKVGVASLKYPQLDQWKYVHEIVEV